MNSSRIFLPKILDMLGVQTALRSDLCSPSCSGQPSTRVLTEQKLGDLSLCTLQSSSSLWRCSTVPPSAVPGFAPPHLGAAWCIYCAEQNFLAFEAFCVSGVQHTSRRAIRHLVWGSRDVRAGLQVFRQRWVIPTAARERGVRPKWCYWHFAHGGGFGRCREEDRTRSKLWSWAEWSPGPGSSPHAVQGEQAGITQQLDVLIKMVAWPWALGVLQLSFCKQRLTHKAAQGHSSLC